MGGENIEAKFPAYKQGNYLKDLINKFENLFFTEYAETHREWNLAIENFCGENSVPIMTIYKSKGLEYSAVYFIGLEESADRWTFFAALSRAKEAVIFTFCKQRTGMKYPVQRHNIINEFFDLLQRPGVAEVNRISR